MGTPFFSQNVKTRYCHEEIAGKSGRGKQPRWWWRKYKRNYRGWETKGADYEFMNLPKAKAM
eukprot:14110658-Ditylum_brightwellii.AAC.1